MFHDEIAGNFISVAPYFHYETHARSTVSISIFCLDDSLKRRVIYYFANFRTGSKRCTAVDYIRLR